MRIRASLFAILWAIIIGPFTILLVCVAGLLAGGPEARPPSRIQIRPGRLRRFRHYRRLKYPRSPGTLMPGEI